MHTEISTALSLDAQRAMTPHPTARPVLQLDTPPGLPFAAAVHAVLRGEAPSPEQLVRIENDLWYAGQLPYDTACALRQLARLGAPPLATLQAIAPLLALDPLAQRLGKTAAEHEAMVVAARLPAAIAAIKAALDDHPAPAYPAARRYGTRFLALLTCAEHSAQDVATFESFLVQQFVRALNDAATSAPTAAALAAAIGSLHEGTHANAHDLAGLRTFGIRHELVSATIAAARAFGWLARAHANAYMSSQLQL
jgi:citrate synthase